MENLIFRMEGGAFSDGYRLDKMVSGLHGTQQILEGVYKGVTGKSRLSKNDRELYKLIAEDVQSGSLLVYLGALFSGVQQTLPFLPSLSPEDMWEYTKASAAFLYDVYKAAHEGKSVTLHQEGENTAVVTEGNENTVHVYHGPVYQIATQIITGFRTLDDALEEDNVKEITLGSKYEKEPAIKMPFGEKGLYYPPVSVDEEPKTINCDIFDFNKYDRIGKLRVSESQQLPEGNYKFKVIGRQEVEDYILSMTEKQVEIHCLVEYENDPLRETRIGSLLIIDVAA
ncbi:hypothetical protein RE428_10390 [Marinobacter nanhaiticus D15-8W]|uniref:Uncharacterized protein n=1 Tax=Marinobacter nanhaiticus D15-8W TaxID=626887 RepID=N6WNT1_9GAMM|nr:hypothetical protein [Marinobacter nanhaiticus]ENO12682.1 hypothetical protein J057_14810 [Marinobacter nanhaiticus D15-8W]BES70021.1 hypothetical protein RE428_10390 [Marinobacter nanhaiticus D15-8W]